MKRFLEAFALACLGLVITLAVFAALGRPIGPLWSVTIFLIGFSIAYSWEDRK